MPPADKCKNWGPFPGGFADSGDTTDVRDDDEIKSNLRVYLVSNTPIAESRMLKFHPGMTVDIGRTSKSGMRSLVDDAQDNVWVESPVMSRQHAQLLYAPLHGNPRPVLTIKDQSSTHGTFVNGEKLAAATRTLMHHRDQITFGSEVIRDIDTFRPCSYIVYLNPGVRETGVRETAVEPKHGIFSVPEAESDEDSDERPDEEMSKSTVEEPSSELSDKSDASDPNPSSELSSVSESPVVPKASPAVTPVTEQEQVPEAHSEVGFASPLPRVKTHARAHVSGSVPDTKDDPFKPDRLRHPFEDSYEAEGASDGEVPLPSASAGLTEDPAREARRAARARLPLIRPSRDWKKNAYLKFMDETSSEEESEEILNQYYHVQVKAAMAKKADEAAVPPKNPTVFDVVEHEDEARGGAEDPYEGEEVDDADYEEEAEGQGGSDSGEYDEIEYDEAEEQEDEDEDEDEVEEGSDAQDDDEVIPDSFVEPAVEGTADDRKAVEDRKAAEDRKAVEDRKAAEDRKAVALFAEAVENKERFERGMHGVLPFVQDEAERYPISPTNYYAAEPEKTVQKGKGGVKAYVDDSSDDEVDEDPTAADKYYATEAEKTVNKSKQDVNPYLEGQTAESHLHIHDWYAAEPIKASKTADAFAPYIAGNTENTLPRVVDLLHAVNDQVVAEAAPERSPSPSDAAMPRAPPFPKSKTHSIADICADDATSSHHKGARAGNPVEPNLYQGVSSAYGGSYYSAPEDPYPPSPTRYNTAAAAKGKGVASGENLTEEEYLLRLASASSYHSSGGSYGPLRPSRPTYPSQDPLRTPMGFESASRNGEPSNYPQSPLDYMKSIEVSAPLLAAHYDKYHGNETFAPKTGEKRKWDVTAEEKLVEAPKKKHLFAKTDTEDAETDSQSAWADLQAALAPLQFVRFDSQSAKGHGVSTPGVDHDNKLPVFPALAKADVVEASAGSKRKWDATTMAESVDDTQSSGKRSNADAVSQTNHEGDGDDEMPDAQPREPIAPAPFYDLETLETVQGGPVRKVTVASGVAPKSSAAPTNGRTGNVPTSTSTQAATVPSAATNKSTTVQGSVEPPRKRVKTTHASKTTSVAKTAAQAIGYITVGAVGLFAALVATCPAD